MFPEVGKGKEEVEDVDALEPASLSSRNWWVVFAPSSRRAKMPRNPGTLGSGTVAYTPAMVLQVRRTGVRVGAGWKSFACAGAVGKAGAGRKGVWSLSFPLGRPALVLA